MHLILALLPVMVEQSRPYCNVTSVRIDDMLFTASYDRGLFGHNANFRRGVVEMKKAKCNEPVWLSTHYIGKLEFPVTLSARDKRLNFNRGCIMDLDLIPLLEPTEFNRRLLRLRLGKEVEDISFVLDRISLFPERLLFPPHRKRDYLPEPPPKTEKAFWNDLNTRSFGFSQEKMEIELEQRHIGVARYDTLLEEPGTVRLFHIFDGKLAMSIEPDYLAEQKDPPGKSKVPERMLRMGKLPAEFCNRELSVADLREKSLKGTLPSAYEDTTFAAYRSGERFYLVTRKGTAFQVDNKGDKELTITPIWTDPKRRLFGVHQEPDGSVFGFGGHWLSKDRFYIKFEPKPVAKGYKLAVPLRNNAEDAFIEAHECLRAITADAKKK